MTKADFLKRLDVQWHDKRIKTDWLGYEQFIDDLMKAELTCGEKLALCREALDAWTRRGHFVGQYLEDYAS